MLIDVRLIIFGSCQCASVSFHISIDLDPPQNVLGATSNIRKHFWEGGLTIDAALRTIDAALRTLQEKWPNSSLVINLLCPCSWSVFGALSIKVNFLITVCDCCSTKNVSRIGILLWFVKTSYFYLLWGKISPIKCNFNFICWWVILYNNSDQVLSEEWSLPLYVDMKAIVWEWMWVNLQPPRVYTYMSFYLFSMSPHIKWKNFPFKFCSLCSWIGVILVIVTVELLSLLICRRVIFILFK